MESTLRKHLIKGLVFAALFLFHSFLLYSAIDKGKGFAIAALCFAVLFFLYGFTAEIRLYRAKQRFRNFSRIKELGHFEETKPIIENGGKKAEEGILFLHGFSASANEMKHLTQLLKESGKPFYAPMFTGFGLDDFHLLRNVYAEDWMRDAVNAYNIIASRAEKVTIIGHSMGGLLALFVAERKPVHNLILSAPYLDAKKEHRKFKKLAQITYFRRLMNKIVPFKSLSTKARLQDADKRGRFIYSMVPSNAVFELWRIQDFVSYGNLQAENAALLYGSNDRTVEIEVVKNLLRKTGLSFAEYEFPNSGHNVFEDDDYLNAVDTVKEILFKTEPAKSEPVTR